MTSQDANQHAAGRFISRRTRLLAAGLYLGLAPFGFRMRSYRRDAFFIAHRNQSLVLFALLGAIALLVFALIVALSVGMIHDRSLVERWPTETWLLSVSRKLLIAWGVFWAYGLLRALRGKADPVPFLGGLNKRRGLRAAGACVVILGISGAFVFSTALCMANHLISSDNDIGRVYMVYDNPRHAPSALFSFAMLPVTITANKQWGRGSVVMTPLSDDGITHALSNGVFVFIASHGTENGLLMDTGYFTPDDVPDLSANKSLAFVYLAGCDSGVQREAWEKALHPARVKSYDRMTPVLEHLWWLWFQGPGVVRQVAASAVS